MPKSKLLRVNKIVKFNLFSSHNCSFDHPYHSFDWPKLFVFNLTFVRLVLYILSWSLISVVIFFYSEERIIFQDYPLVIFT